MALSITNTHNENILERLASFGIKGGLDDSDGGVFVDRDSIVNASVTKGLGEEEAYDFALSLIREMFDRKKIMVLFTSKNDVNLFLTVYNRS